MTDQVKIAIGSQEIHFASQPFFLCFICNSICRDACYFVEENINVAYLLVIIVPEIKSEIVRAHLPGFQCALVAIILFGISFITGTGKEIGFYYARTFHEWKNRVAAINKGLYQVKVTPHVCV